MTLHSSTTSETDDIEFSAAYGTAVVMTGARRPAIRNHQAGALEGSSGTLITRPNSVQQTARLSTPLAAANDAGKRHGKRSLLRSELNGRRKAA
jgi:hypothetical protein